MGKRGRRSRETIMSKRSKNREIYDRSPVAGILLGSAPATSFDADVLQLVADIEDLHNDLTKRGWTITDYSDLESISWQRSNADGAAMWISLDPTDDDYAPIAKVNWLLTVELERTGIRGQDEFESEILRFPAAMALKSLQQIEAGQFPMDSTLERDGE